MNAAVVERRSLFYGVRSLVAALVALAMAGAALAQDVPGDDFLRLLDARQYGESWDASSDFLKQSISRADWQSQMVRTRETIGEVGSRKLKSSVPQKDPQGAPPGEYIIQTYDTVFASQGAPKTETLPLVKAADGRWRAVGYFIR